MGGVPSDGMLIGYESFDVIDRVCLPSYESMTHAFNNIK